MSLVEIKNLEHRYGNHTVLAGLNLTLEEGEIIGLLGPNGVGKTTPYENPLRFDSEL